MVIDTLYKSLKDSKIAWLFKDLEVSYYCSDLTVSFLDFFPHKEKILVTNGYLQLIPLKMNIGLQEDLSLKALLISAACSEQVDLDARTVVKDNRCI